MVYTYDVQPHWHIKINERAFYAHQMNKKMDLLIPRVWRMGPHIAEQLGKFTDALNIRCC